MIETKMFELRDSGTFIPIIASLMTSAESRERWLLRRAGYSLIDHPLVLLTSLNGGTRAEYDPYAWGGRTYPAAHDYIASHWDELRSGQLIDVRVIVGETAEPCETEQIA